MRLEQITRAFAIGMVAMGLSFQWVSTSRADDPPKTEPPDLPKMDQAAQDWLNAPGSAAFGKWLSQVLEKHPDHPEWLAMYADILQGSRLGPTDGWFRKAVAQRKHTWDVVRARFDTDSDGKIARGEFRGTSSDFATLDRDGDSYIGEADLNWPEHALTSTPGAMLYMQADADSDGRVTKDEFDKLFAEADRDSRGYLSQDELRALLSPPPAAPAGSAPRPSGPSKATLVRGLFDQEIGAMKPGPSVGHPAPDFRLRSVAGDREYQLSELLGQKPVVLVFGNITCGPFRSQAGNVQKIFERYKDRAHFLMIYVREAHPTDGWHMTFNDRFDVTLAQPKSYDERASVAQTCQRKLGFEMPFLVDTIDDKVGGAYSGMPSRLYVIEPDGTVAYKSGRGPFGFKPAEMEQSLIFALAENQEQAAGNAGNAAVAPAAPASDQKTEAAPAASEPAQASKPKTARVPLLDNRAAWERLPVVRDASATPVLPAWARALAHSLPRATAAMLVLDYRHRAQSPLDPILRARMRRAAAEANRCDYTRAYAEADLRRLGQDPSALESDPVHSTPEIRAALDFARQLTTDASAVTDEHVAFLIEKYGPEKFVAMVQLLAYANFQDRLIHTLGLKVEPGGPLPPFEVAIDPKITEIESPKRAPREGVTGPPGPERVDDPAWAELDVEKVRTLLDSQKSRSSRIPVPSWDDVVKRLPPGATKPPKPVRIQWSLVCMGYQPLLGAAWSACTRGFALDAKQDRVFEESLFWVVTRTIHCFY